MQKKYLVVGLIAAIVLLGIVIATQKAQNSGPVCVQFIKAIEKGDVAGSYKFFSANAQKATSLDSWKKTVASTGPFYNNNTPILKSSDSTGNAKDGTLQVREYYTVGTGNYQYLITCIRDDTKITGFTSK
jgi:hypothetical protein